MLRKREERQLSVWRPGVFLSLPPVLSLWPPWTLPGVNLRPSGCTCLPCPLCLLRGRASSVVPLQRLGTSLQPLILEALSDPPRKPIPKGKKFQNSLQAVLNKGWASGPWLAGSEGLCVCQCRVGWGGGVVSMGGGQRCHRRAAGGHTLSHGAEVSHSPLPSPALPHSHTGPLNAARRVALGWAPSQAPAARRFAFSTCPPILNGAGVPHRSPDDGDGPPEAAP